MANKNHYRQVLILGDKQLVDVNSLALILDLHPEHIRRLTRTNQLPAIKSGNRWWYHVETCKQARQNANNTVHTGTVIDDLGF